MKNIILNINGIKKECSIAYSTYVESVGKRFKIYDVLGEKGYAVTAGGKKVLAMTDRGDIISKLVVLNYQPKEKREDIRKNAHKYLENLVKSEKIIKILEEN